MQNLFVDAMCTADAKWDLSSKGILLNLCFCYPVPDQGCEIWPLQIEDTRRIGVWIVMSTAHSEDYVCAASPNSCLSPQVPSACRVWSYTASSGQIIICLPCLVCDFIISLVIGQKIEETAMPSSKVHLRISLLGAKLGDRLHKFGL